MEDDEDPEGAAPLSSERPQKRARQAIVDDEDDEQEAGAGAGAGADGEADAADDLFGDEAGADGGGGEQPAEQSAGQPADDAFDKDGRLDDADATLEDLFGSDDEE